MKISISEDAKQLELRSNMDKFAVLQKVRSSLASGSAVEHPPKNQRGRQFNSQNWWTESTRGSLPRKAWPDVCSIRRTLRQMRAEGQKEQGRRERTGNSGRQWEVRTQRRVGPSFWERKRGGGWEVYGERGRDTWFWTCALKLQVSSFLCQDSRPLRRPSSVSSQRILYHWKIKGIWGKLTHLSFGPIQTQRLVSLSHLCSQMISPFHRRRLGGSEK